MLKRIRIRGFESHEDTVLEGFSPSFNAIVGLSNSGKTAVIRALMLVGYNEFSQDSLRHGCENCIVEVETDKGTIKVTRGKKNLWELHNFATGKKSVFDRPGKTILPEVPEILGFGLIKLGDVEMQVNIMNQLEAHFMLEEFAGQDATGSLRAQVVDEISGLHGIEPLIRDVGLDNNRLTREVNQLEERKKELATQLHDEAAMKTEEVLLGKVSALVGTHDENGTIVAMLQGMMREHADAYQTVVNGRRELAGLPDEKQAGDLTITAAASIEDARKMAADFDEWDVERRQTADLADALGKLPDSSRAAQAAESAAQNINKSSSAWSLKEDVATEQQAVSRLNVQLAAFGDEVGADAKLKVAAAKFDMARLAGEMLEIWLSQKTELAEATDALKRTDEELKRAKTELEEALKDVDVCPVTMGAISEECRKQARAGA